ncbi:MAG TPA: hypothetical protein PKA62_19905 [Thermoanaerobaculia bacterium]|nr:hypothetical protein [Thermoanaerobaculia bacterium]
MSGFDAARLGALVHDLLAVVRRRPADLLPFEEVRERLKLSRVVDRGTSDVPLEKIVGTFGRRGEFNRAFLPRSEALRERWEDVKDLAEGAAGFPPVELYLVGDAYFAVDGHHRVSVARSLGARTIEAHVLEFLTPVPLGPDASLEDVLRKEGLADFLEATGLVPSSPDEFRVTHPGDYAEMLEHIAVHRYFLGQEHSRCASWEEAVRSWYETFFRPMTETIRASGVLADFPARTEADLYLFVARHLHALRERWGDGVAPARAVKHLRLQTKRSRSRNAKG